jgi:plasmid maintenance system antidote protein VapI
VTIKARVVQWLHDQQPPRTQMWLAKQLKVSPQYVAMILNGRRTPSLPIALRLEDLTGIPAKEFISRAA